MTIRSVVRGVGSYLPEKVLTNDDLTQIVETSDEWITQRTGIRERHIAATGEMTSDLAVKAAQRALEAAGLTVADIDMILVATATPDHTFPSTATIVQHKLGMTHGFAFDLAAVCAGFVYAVTMADSLLKTGHGRRALVIGAETFSRILDWTDRTTCVLFGDGSGAMILEAMPEDQAQGRGVLASCLRSDGQHKEKLFVNGGVSSTQSIGHVVMEGKEVFRFAVGAVNDVIIDVMQKTGIVASDLDWFVPHQANQRIIDGSAKKLGIPPEKVVSTVAGHGNTSAASIPLALDAAVRDGRIKANDLVLLEAIGGGFTWGAVTVRW